MAVSEASLDETFWQDRIMAEHEFQGIHANTVLFYFQRSTFFDLGSINHAIFNDAFRFQKLDILSTRDNFENAIRSFPSGGTQFLVVHEPPPGEQGWSGAWVIQKQQRTVTMGQEDKVDILATYWVLGDRIFQAPSVADILGNRILSVTTAISSFFDIASNLSSFTPATGHTYFPPNLKPSSKTSATGAFSRASSPGAPASDTQSTAERPSSQAGDSAAARATITDAKFSDAVFSHALTQTHFYSHEYTDENPIQGEPGQFRLQFTDQRVAEDRKKQADALARVQESVSLGPMSVGLESALSTAAPTPRPMHEHDAGSRKSSGAGLKRRKSKPTSPT